MTRGELLALSDPESVAIDLEASSDPAVVVTLHGDLDAAAARDLETLLSRAGLLGQDLVVDLRRVEFIDAAIVGVLARSNSLLARRLRSLVLRDPSNAVRRVLHLCGLQGLVDDSGGNPLLALNVADHPSRFEGDRSREVDVRQQRPIVRDQQHRSPEGIECDLELFDRRQVEVIGWLVEHQQVGAGRHE
jgi:anti-anti-sigma factor